MFATKKERSEKENEIILSNRYEIGEGKLKLVKFHVCVWVCKENFPKTQGVQLCK